MSEEDPRWAVADRLSDRIVDVVNGELALMRAAHAIDGKQLLAGQLLALLATFGTMPDVKPMVLAMLEVVARAALEQLQVGG